MTLIPACWADPSQLHDWYDSGEQVWSASAIDPQVWLNCSRCNERIGPMSRQDADRVLGVSRWASCAEPPPEGEPTAAAGQGMSEDCPRCGHVVVLHSRSRGCVGCRLEPEPTR